MTQEDIVAMLKNPAKPDLEGIKKFCLEDGDGTWSLLLNTSAEYIKHWGEAGNIISAKSMVSRKFHPDRSKASRQKFVRENYGYRGESKAVKEAMSKAGVKAWQKTLMASDPLKKKPHTFFQFYISLFIGGDDGAMRSHELMDEDSWRDSNDLWPSSDTTGVKQSFLTLLSNGDRNAVTLAKFGYQDVLISDSKYITFIKLPKQIVLESIRGRWQMSNVAGPARRSSGELKEYWYRGVQFEAPGTTEPTNHWRRVASFDKYFKDGKVIATVKDALKEANAEARRVLMESFEPEEILKSCKAQLVSKESDKDKNVNELFLVDIGLTDTWRTASAEMGDDITAKDADESKRRPNLAKMLRYTCPSTGRVYTKFVPFTMKTANEAQAWGHHMTMEEYVNELVAQS